jgi:Tfp pilus assembly protein PilO
MKFSLDKLVEKFNQLDLKVRYGILAVVVGWIIVLDYALLMQFQVGAIKKMNAEIKTLSSDTQRVKNESQRIAQIMRNVSGTQSQVKEFNTKIRALQDVALVLEDISSIANKNHVSIDQISPAKEGQEELLTMGNIKYYGLPIVITARCGYHMFGRFLNELESAHLLFFVNDLQVLQSEKPNGLSIRITLKVVLMEKTEDAKT